MKEKYGFVYIWFDRKHKRYYIGSHWGTADDGYICSSSWMKAAYKRRPLDFSRRILQVTSNREILFSIENDYLGLIKTEELGSRYYNLQNFVNGHWHLNENQRKAVGEKISRSTKGRKISEEHARKVSEGNKKNGATRGAKISASLKGRKRTDEEKRAISEGRKRIMNDEMRQKIREQRTGYSWGSHTEETKQKIGASSRKYWNERHIENE